LTQLLPNSELDGRVNETINSKSSYKTIFVAAAMLWVTLLCWAVGSPMLSAPDQGYHLAHVWCANGVDQQYCISSNGSAAGRTVSYAVNGDYCYLTRVDKPVLCGPNRSLNSPKNTLQSYYVGNSNYPNGFYSVMNLLVTQNTTLSVILMRIFNATLAVVLFIFQMILGSRKQRVAWLSAFIFTVIPLALFLIPSVNGSSWSIIGVTNAWMFLIIALTLPKNAKKQRRLAVLLWLASAFMCIASRYDSTIFFVITNALTFFAVKLISFKQNAKRTMSQLFLTSIIGLGLLFSTKERLTFLKSNLSIRTTPFNPLGANFGQWLTSWFMHFLAIPQQALGSGRLGWEEIPLPTIVSIIGSGFVFSVLLFAALKISLTQVVVAGSATLLMFVTVLRIANMELDLFNVSGRYVLPLVPFVVGTWVYFSHSEIQLIEIKRFRDLAIISLSITQAISLYTLLERYVMGASGGLRILRLDGVNQWWWPSVVLGPNFIVVIGSLCFCRFLISALQLIPASPVDVRKVLDVAPS
jgi:hypothetical protein